MLRMLAARTFTVGVPIAEKTSRAVNVPLRRAATTKAAAAPPPAGGGETHTKTALIAMVAEELKLPKTEVGKVIDATLDNIMKTVAKGDKVQIIGFGTFESRFRAAREGRNPATGEAMKIAASNSPAFSAGKKFKDAVKGEDKPAAAKPKAPANK